MSEQSPGVVTHLETMARIARAVPPNLGLRPNTEPVSEQSEPTAIRYPRGLWHRPDDVFDLVICRGRFDGFKTVEESALSETDPARRCRVCWKDQA